MQKSKIVKLLTLSWSRLAKPYYVAYNTHLDLTVVRKEFFVAGLHISSHLELVRFLQKQKKKKTLLFLQINPTYIKLCMLVFRKNTSICLG